MNLNDLLEEKTRLDPACWHNKKIGNPKTKMKGGVRVNNCVPAESVEEGANVTSQIKRIKDRILQLKDWNTAGTHDKKIKELQTKLKELQSQKQGVAEGDVVPFERPNSSKENFMFSGVSYFMKDQALPFFQKNNIKIVNVEKFEDEGITEVVIQTTKEKARLLSNRLESMSDDEYGGYFIAQGELMEDFNAEYDDEAGMAQGSLHTLKNAVEGLQDVIDAGDNLPEWCQEKISLAEDYLVTVWDYIQSEKAQGVDPEIEEMYEAMEQLAEEMAQRNRVSVDRVWESFEALDDHMLWETAAWRRKEGKSKTGGLNAKGVASYRREHPGSKLQTAVTTKPSKLKPGSKAAKRRKSFCARMSGVKGPMKKPNGKPTRKALALRKWNC